MVFYFIFVGVSDDDEGSYLSLLQVQRGFRSVLVYLTALDSTSDFLAVGSSIGMLYLYCRRQAHMNKYSLEVRALILLFSLCVHSWVPPQSSVGHFLF